MKLIFYNQYQLLPILVLVISPWEHYCHWSKEGYKQILLKIREGILKFKVWCPDVPIIIKGAHPRERKTIESRIYFSNYLLHEIDVLMKDIFYGSGAWVLDVWYLNVSYPATNKVHMPVKCVKQELMSFLTYISRKKFKSRKFKRSSIRKSNHIAICHFRAKRDTQKFRSEIK